MTKSNHQVIGVFDEFFPLKFNSDSFDLLLHFFYFPWLFFGNQVRSLHPILGILDGSIV